MLIALCACSVAQKATGNDTSLDPDSLAVYKVFLASYQNGSDSKTNVSETTIPFVLDQSVCVADVDPEDLKVKKHTTHRLTAEQLSPEVRLVDRKKQSQKVKENDPGNAIREGRKVDDAVRQGFANGLLTMSEVVFDKKHRHAYMTFSFVCGGLCGHGGTVSFKKVGDKWRQEENQCGGWIS